MLLLSVMQIDVYSFGIVMWELVTGEEPYADMHCASIIGKHQVPTDLPLYFSCDQLLFLC